ncbi:unnamed protein product [Sphagnum jensenii]|uniref:Uncharacterized protein n=1 Tax=Sphagnum jensenii TaxID=128206 RepID=A0ABP1APC8_9BRYO
MHSTKLKLCLRNFIDCKQLSTDSDLLNAQAIARWPCEAAMNFLSLVACDCKMDEWQEYFGGELLVKRLMAQLLCCCLKPRSSDEVMVGIYKEIEHH